MFKRTIKTGFIALLTSAALVSCINDEIVDPDTLTDGVSGIELQIFSDTQTRATTNYENTEKRMETVDLFFYATDANESTDVPVLVWHSKPSAEGKLTLRIPEDRLTTIFGSENKCKVYAVVNSQETTKMVEEAVDYYNEHGQYEDGKLSITSLRDLMASTAAFTQKTEIPAMVMFTDATAGDDVTYDSSERKATGHLIVNMLAAKIDLFVGFAAKITGKDPTDEDNPDVEFEWTPYIVNGVLQARAVIEDGVQTVRLGGWQTGTIEEDGYFTVDIDERDAPRRLFTKDDTTYPDFPWRISKPIYTYPNEWDTDLQNHRSKLTMKVYWKRGARVDKSPVDNELHTLATYFTVPIIRTEDGAAKIESNKYYRIRADIQTLGDPRYVTPVELEDCYYEILDWGATADMPSDARVPRYLEVQKIKTVTTFRHFDDQYSTDDDDNNDYQTIECAAIMNNSTRVTFSYSSSHPIEVESLKITYLDFYPESADREMKSERDIKNFKSIPTSVFVPKVNGKAVNRDINSGLSFVWGNLRAENLDEFDTYPERTALYIDEANKQITFQHPFSPIKEEHGEYIPQGDRNLYTPYLITIVLKHIDHEGVRETVNIMQYPAMYVENEFNDGHLGHRLNMGNAAIGYALRGGVYVNGGSGERFRGDVAGESNNSSQLGGISGLRWAGNFSNRFSNNPNMYIVNVTQFSENDNVNGIRLRIGDPRSNHSNTLLSGESDLTDSQDILDRWEKTSTKAGLFYNYKEAPVTAARLYAGHDSGTEGKISYYYPTKEGQTDEEQFMVAPKFRIQSIYGTVRNDDKFKTGMTRERARIRCAAYQEMGYPAGRWRLPTRGELQIIANLIHQNVIPDILGHESNGDSRAHWTAQGLYKMNDATGNLVHEGSTSSTTARMVVCVYDDWYWIKQDGSADNLINPHNASLPQITRYIGRDVEVSGVGTVRTPNDDPREVFVWGDKKKANPQDRPNQQ